MIEERLESATFGLLAGDLIGSGSSFRFCARGRSMMPTIQDGDVLCVEPLGRMPKRGDIVLFFRQGEFKAHRIVEIRPGEFVARGDAGIESDGIVKREEIIGKVTAKECRQSGRRHRLGEWERLTFLASRAVRARLEFVRRRQRKQASFVPQNRRM